MYKISLKRSKMYKVVPEGKRTKGLVTLSTRVFIGLLFWWLKKTLESVSGIHLSIMFALLLYLWMFKKKKRK